MYRIKKGKRRSSLTVFLSILLSLCLVVTLTPMTSFADEQGAYGQADTNAATPDVPARAGLVTQDVSQANIDMLNTLIDGILDLGNGSYKPEAWKAYSEAWEAAKKIVLDPTSYGDAEAEAAIDALQDAEDALYDSFVDKTSLKNAIDQAELFIANRTLYYPPSIDLLETKLMDVKSIYEDQDATQVEVNSAFADLFEAIQQLYLIDEKTPLFLLIKYANHLTAASYTPASWRDFPDALENAKTVYASSTTGAAITDAYNALSEEIAGLQPRADFAALKVSIAAADIIMGQKNDYIASTLTGLEAALTDAKAVAAELNATQAEVNAAASALDARILAAGLKPELDALRSALQIATGLDLTVYTDASVGELTAARDAATALLGKGDALTQREADAATDAVVKAIQGLKKKADVTESGDGGDVLSDIGNIGFYEGVKPLIADKTWTGSLIKPTISLKTGARTLQSGVDYTIAYTNNKNIGRATATITGLGTFTGIRTIYFKILPKKTSVSKTIAGKKQLKVTWKKVSAKQKVSKYQVRYRVKGKSKWKTKTVSAKSGSTTLKKLAKGKTYQIQVRSYKTVKTDGKSVKYYSAWSSIKTSKKIK